MKSRKRAGRPLGSKNKQVRMNVSKEALRKRRQRWKDNLQKRKERGLPVRLIDLVRYHPLPRRKRDSDEKQK
jgi:hypothetical protein